MLLVLKVCFDDGHCEEYVADNFNFVRGTFFIYLNRKVVREVCYSCIIMFYCIPFEKGVI